MGPDPRGAFSAKKRTPASCETGANANTLLTNYTDQMMVGPVGPASRDKPMGMEETVEYQQVRYAGPVAPGHPKRRPHGMSAKAAGDIPHRCQHNGPLVTGESWGPSLTRPHKPEVFF